MNKTNQELSWRNEDDHCPGCGQHNALHPKSQPPGINCELSKGEHGLDTEHYRDDEPGHDEFGRATYNTNRR